MPSKSLSVIGFLMADPDPVGNWKLSGLKVDYLHITRMNATTDPADASWGTSLANGGDGSWSVYLDDAYGVGIRVPVSSIPGGVLFQRFENGPFKNFALFFSKTEKKV